MNRVPILAALTALLLLTTSAPAQAGQTFQRTYGNAAGTRGYTLYVPTGGGAGKPLMIWLHGCGGADPAGLGSSLPKVAEELGVTVAAPVQPSSANAGQCWNWFDAAHQHRGAGEPSIIAGITTTVRDELASDPDRIYVGGYSAGGAMTSVMAAAYPDLYAAIAPSAGAPYAFDPTGQAAYREMGSRARPVPAFVLQGVLDEISVYPLGRANILQWLGTDDYADDGASNNSVSRLPAGVTPTVIQTDIPLPVAIERYTWRGCAVGEFWTSPYEHLLNGALFYYDQGRELQRRMMGFLLAHRLGGPGQGCG
jgi:poly(hydroxyalkanoate) depolymerase family esterase